MENIKEDAMRFEGRLAGEGLSAASCFLLFSSFLFFFL